MATKKKSISQLKKQADKYFSLATRYRFAEKDGYVRCVTCDSRKHVKDMQCGHFQSRRFSKTRFSEENTAPQCVKCNMFNQGEQYKFGKYIDDLYGDGTAQRLVQEAHTIYKFTTGELEEIIADAKTEIAFYEKNPDGLL